jgi:heme exporter protein D
MIKNVIDFFFMGGYAWYVFGAYSAVFAFLFIQWFLPWRRWQKYLHDQTKS